MLPSTANAPKDTDAEMERAQAHNPPAIDPPEIPKLLERRVLLSSTMTGPYHVIQAIAMAFHVALSVRPQQPTVKTKQRSPKFCTIVLVENKCSDYTTKELNDAEGSRVVIGPGSPEPGCTMLAMKMPAETAGYKSSLTSLMGGECID